MPRRQFQIVGTREPCLAQLLLQREFVASGRIAQGSDEPRGVRHDDHLGAVRRPNDESAQRGQKIGMQARLRFVQHQQPGGTRGPVGGVPTAAT